MDLEYMPRCVLDTDVVYVGINVTKKLNNLTILMRVNIIK